MRRRAAWREQGAALLIGLSLWMALPSARWCAIDLGCEPARCPLAGPCDGAMPVDARVVCVGGAIDGLVPRGSDPAPPDAPSIFADVVSPPMPPAPEPARARIVERAGLCPAVVAAHAPPLTRAPPRTLSS